MESKIETLKRKGYTVTMQRTMVLDKLVNITGHPTAEEIYEALNVRYPSLSKATVYNSLEIFRKAGIIQELVINKGKARYDSNSYPHFHFHCTKCGSLYDISASNPILETKEINGHKVEKIKACFYGVCKNCMEGKQD